MKELMITVFFISTFSVIRAERLDFHVTTVYGEDLSGVEIKVIEDPKHLKRTRIDGTCIIWSETDKFQDVGIIVQKRGWTVIQPELGNYFRIDYREKARVIQIVMQQNEEIGTTPTKEFASKPITYSAVSKKNIIPINTRTTIKNFQIQIKASSSPISATSIEAAEARIGMEVSQIYLAGQRFPYKYRIILNVESIEDAEPLLSIIKSAGFQDAFLVNHGKGY
jgi:hypothetical protein